MEGEEVRHGREGVFGERTDLNCTKTCASIHDNNKLLDCIAERGKGKVSKSVCSALQVRRNCPNGANALYAITLLY